jgi:hypothetical protein
MHSMFSFLDYGLSCIVAECPVDASLLLVVEAALPLGSLIINFEGPL